MTLSPLLSAPDATTVALDFGVFIAEQARIHRVSQTAIIAALRPCITPSQPEAPSKPHAPAADTPATQAAGDTTDGEEPPNDAPSVTPNSPETAPSGEAAQAAAAGESPALQAPSIGAQPMGGEDVAPPDDTQRTQTLDAAAQGSTLAGETTGSAVRAGVPKHLSPKTRLVVQCHAEHPDWPVKVIAEHLGLTKGSVSGHAAIAKIKLPSQTEWDKAQKAKTTEALRKSPEAEEPSAEPQSEPAPDLPPLSLPSERLPPPPVVRRARAAPTGRFYLRDKTTGHFAHQSLQPNPAGDGPMMTFDRKWAWYDTMERYRGAKKRWPQIEAMRKEAVSK